MQWEGAAPMLSAYPNPASDYVKIETLSVGRLTLYDASGSRLREVAVKAGVNEIDIRNLPSGLYFGVMDGQVIRWVKK